jgi:hypothetical protein
LQVSRLVSFCFQWLFGFKAKATVISTGAGGFKPAGWPMANLTADGHAMAYRVGAEITGKEFADTHGTRSEIPALVAGSHPTPQSTHFRASNQGRGPSGPGGIVNAEGIVTFVNIAFQKMFGFSADELVGKSAFEMPNYSEQNTLEKAAVRLINVEKAAKDNSDDNRFGVSYPCTHLRIFSPVCSF